MINGARTRDDFIELQDQQNMLLQNRKAAMQQGDVQQDVIREQEEILLQESRKLERHRILDEQVAELRQKLDQANIELELAKRA